MSVIACKIYKDKIIVGSDSIIVKYWTQQKVGQNAENNTKMGKLFEINNIIIGCTGSALEASLLKIFCATRQPCGSKDAEILDFFVDFAEWKKKRTERYCVENSYIFIFKGKAFEINGFFVDEVLKYSAIGAGMDYALAALYLGKTIKEALEAACELSVFCERPINIIEKEK